VPDEDPAPEEEPNAAIKLLTTVTPNFLRQSYAAKFGLVLVVMALLVGVIGYAATGAIAAETENNVENDFRSVALQESDIIQEWNQRNRLATTLVSDSQTLRDGGGGEIRVSLREEMGSLATDVHEMHVIEPTGDGYQVVGSTSLEAGTAVSEVDRGWIDERSDELADLAGPRVIVQDTYRDGSQRVVAYLSPVTGNTNRVLLLETSIFDISTTLEGAEDGENRFQNGFTRVVNAENNVVMVPDAGDGGSALLSPYSLSSTARQPLEEAAELRSDGSQGAGVITDMPPNSGVLEETYTVGYAPVQGTNWVVVTHAPRAQVFGFVQTVQSWGLYATIGAVLLIGIVGTALGLSTARAIDRLTRKTEEMQEGDLDVSFYTHRIDNIGRLYDGFADMRDSLKEQIQEAERSEKEAEVARAEAEEMATHLQQKAEEYSETMQQCGAGDLTQRMSKDGEEESMDRIADEFNEMIEELEKTTGQLKSYVDEVEEAGAEVESSANTVREASEQVAESIQNISDGAYDQKERLQRISETMDSIAARFEDISREHPEVDFDDALDEIRQVAGDLEETAKLSEETMAESENVAGAAEEQAAELNEVGERAHDLQRYAQPLRDILNRFETEAEHEFVFSVGPTGGSATPSVSSEDDDGDDQENQ